MSVSVVFILAMAAIAGAVFYVVMVFLMETQNKRTLKRIVKQLKDWRDDDGEA